MILLLDPTKLAESAAHGTNYRLEIYRLILEALTPGDCNENYMFGIPIDANTYYMDSSEVEGLCETLSILMEDWLYENAADNKRSELDELDPDDPLVRVFKPLLNPDGWEALLEIYAEIKSGSSDDIDKAYGDRMSLD
jgi:hypothetical protein